MRLDMQWTISGHLPPILISSMADASSRRAARPGQLGPAHQYLHCVVTDDDAVS
jgi:hypothetical protein